MVGMMDEEKALEMVDPMADKTVVQKAGLLVGLKVG